MSNDLQDRIAGVLTGHPIGGGYYGTTVGRDEALDGDDYLTVARVALTAAIGDDGE